MPPPTVPPPKMPSVTVGVSADMKRALEEDDRDRVPIPRLAVGAGAKVKPDDPPVQKTTAAMIDRWKRIMDL